MNNEHFASGSTGSTARLGLNARGRYDKYSYEGLFSDFPDFDDIPFEPDSPLPTRAPTNVDMTLAQQKFLVDNGLMSNDELQNFLTEADVSLTFPQETAVPDTIMQPKVEAIVPETTEYDQYMTLLPFEGIDRLESVAEPNMAMLTTNEYDMNNSVVVAQPCNTTGINIAAEGQSITVAAEEFDENIPIAAFETITEQLPIEGQPPQCSTATEEYTEKNAMVVPVYFEENGRVENVVIPFDEDMFFNEVLQQTANESVTAKKCRKPKDTAKGQGVAPKSKRAKDENDQFAAKVSKPRKKYERKPKPFDANEPPKPRKKYERKNKAEKAAPELEWPADPALGSVAAAGPLSFIEMDLSVDPKDILILPPERTRKFVSNRRNPPAVVPAVSTEPNVPSATDESVVAPAVEDDSPERELLRHLTSVDIPMIPERPRPLAAQPGRRKQKLQIITGSQDFSIETIPWDDIEPEDVDHQVPTPIWDPLRDLYPDIILPEVEEIFARKKKEYRKSQRNEGATKRSAGHNNAQGTAQMTTGKQEKQTPSQKSYALGSQIPQTGKPRPGKLAEEKAIGKPEVVTADKLQQSSVGQSTINSIEELFDSVELSDDNTSLSLMPFNVSSIPTISKELLPPVSPDTTPTQEYLPRADSSAKSSIQTPIEPPKRINEVARIPSGILKDISSTCNSSPIGTDKIRGKPESPQHPLDISTKTLGTMEKENVRKCTEIDKEPPCKILVKEGKQLSQATPLNSSMGRTKSISIDEVEHSILPLMVSNITKHKPTTPVTQNKQTPNGRSSKRDWPMNQKTNKVKTPIPEPYPTKSKGTSNANVSSTKSFAKLDNFLAGDGAAFKAVNSFESDFLKLVRESLKKDNGHEQVKAAASKSLPMETRKEPSQSATSTSQAALVENYKKLPLKGTPVCERGSSRSTSKENAKGLNQNTSDYNGKNTTGAVSTSSKTKEVIKAATNSPKPEEFLAGAQRPQRKCAAKCNKSKRNLRSNL